MFYDWTIVLVIPAAIFAMWAQFKVNGTFKKYSGVANMRGVTGAEVAKTLLDNAGVVDVRIERIPGNLTDHYDPRTKTLRLSEPVYASNSVAALGVAAHETGHAIQHATGYTALSVRNSITPAASFASKASVPVIIIGILLASLARTSIGLTLVEVGIILFTVVLIFQLVTLPVEFNASSRAINMLQDTGILTHDELIPAKKVLSAAAMTYVAAVAVTLMTLLRYIMIAGGMKRNN